MTEEKKREKAERRSGYGRREEDREVIEARHKFANDLKKIKRLTRLQLLTGILALISLISVIILLDQVETNQTDIHTLIRANHVRSVESHKLALLGLRQGREIQQERVQAILKNCRETNHKHRATIRRLIALQKEFRPHETPQQRAQEKESRAGTISLIDQFEPLTKNCFALVHKATTVKQHPQTKGS